MAGVGDIVRVTTTIQAAGVAERDFGRTLFLEEVSGSITARAAAARLRGVGVFADASEVAEANPSDELEAAANVYFAQSPFPKNLLSGSVIGMAQPTLIFGAEGRVVATIEVLGDNVSMEVGGETMMADFDGLTSFADIAAALATGLNAVTGITGATVTVDGTAFNVNIPATFDAGEGFAENTATLALGIAGAGSLTLARIETAESVTDALNRIEQVDDTFYWIVPEADIASDQTKATAVANWGAARVTQPVIDLQGAEVLVANEAASIGAMLAALKQNGVSGIYNGAGIDNKAIAYAGIFSGINFSAPNSLITGKFKTLASVAVTDLSTAQRNELVRKRINHYTVRGGEAMTAEGVNFGTWTDVQYWLDWFQNALEVAAFGTLKAAGRVPQTESGVSALVDALTGVCETGVRNGGIAPNNVTPVIRSAIQNATGNPDFDGFLSTGYLIYAVPIAEQSPANREARKSPAIKIWAKGSGAIHSVDIAVVFEN